MSAQRVMLHQSLGNLPSNICTPSYLAEQAVKLGLQFRYLPVLLSLTLFIAVLAALTRSYRDSEMVVWFSAGRSLKAWLTPVLLFALPFVFSIALLSLALSPWAVRKSEEFRHQM